MGTVAIIPARLTSTRFPYKLLHKLNGKRIIDHVIENTRNLEFVDSIIIASDDKEFAKSLCEKHKFLNGYHISDDVLCGSHRSYKYYLEEPDYDFYISIPADEPAIDSTELNKVLNKDTKLSMNEITTFYTKFYCKEDLSSPLSCKIVTDDKNIMIYNSRNVVPVNKDGSYLSLEKYKKHVGIFIFPNDIFFNYGDIWKHTVDIESLEQNRFMQHPFDVRMIEMKHIGFGIDVQEQINELEFRIKKGVIVS